MVSEHTNEVIMSQTLIILSPELESLGEVAVRDGEFLSVALNGRGERELSEAFEEWQTRGLPAIKSEISRAEGKVEFMTGVNRVQLRSPLFENAFAAWLSSNGYYSLALSDHAICGWNALCQLPLDPRERLMMAFAFRDLHPDKLPSWIQATEKLVKETLQ